MLDVPHRQDVGEVCNGTSHGGKDLISRMRWSAYGCQAHLVCPAFAWPCHGHARAYYLFPAPDHLDHLQMGMCPPNFAGPDILTLVLAYTIFMQSASCCGCVRGSAHCDGDGGGKGAGPGLKAMLLPVLVVPMPIIRSRPMFVCACHSRCCCFNSR